MLRPRRRAPKCSATQLMHEHLLSKDKPPQLTMDNSYFSYPLDGPQHDVTRHTMAPPHSQSSIQQTVHADHDFSVHRIGPQLMPASNIHSDPVDLYSSLYQSIGQPFTAHRPLELNLGISSSATGSSYQRTDSSARPQNSSGRTTTITSDVWTRHKSVIHRLWITEDKSLPETKTIMSEKYHFEASLDQYKKQISRWKWSKYIPAKTGNWMMWKADHRKREQGKDTTFIYRGQTLDEASIRLRVERKRPEGVSRDSPGPKTPRDLKYTTPRSAIESPLGTQVTPVRSCQTAQPPWTPPVNSNQSQPQVRLLWNGRTKTHYQAQYTEALGDERCGRSDQAEAKLRSALEGYDHLLSTTHPETVAISYKLASFFAKQVRMQDADTVLDWLTQAHTAAFGFRDTRTVSHLLNVCEMFRDWDRPKDSTGLLQQVFGEQNEGLFYLHSAQSAASAASHFIPSSSADSTTVFNMYDQVHGFSIPLEGPIETSLLQSYTRQATSDSQAGECMEAVLLRLIRHCEQFPDEHIAHSLLCYPILLDHYENIQDVVKRSEAFNQAEQTVWKILRSGKKKTKSDLVACLQLAKYFVKVSRFESADDIFSQIECDAEEAFSFHHDTRVWFLENIGAFYQDMGRWQDAAPRFQHALAVQLSRFGCDHESVRRLEVALENRHFEQYVPSVEGETSWTSHCERPIHKPQYVCLGTSIRGRQKK